MTVLFGMFLLTLLVITAIAIIRASDLFVAVMLSGIFSLLMALIFFILDAADVALTEAAVGAGISTVLFLSALALTEQSENTTPPVRWVIVPILVFAALIVYAIFDVPTLGDPDAPVHQHLTKWYLEQTPELVDIPNLVTAILGSFRGYDTLGEVFVVLTAALGVMSLLGSNHSSEPRPVKPAWSSQGLRHHLIPRVVGRILIPFIILFGLYVQFHGEYGPGGGFQAGALVAAAIILYALLEGEGPALTVIPVSAISIMMASGAVLYTLVGLAGIALGGNFLDYSVLLDDPITGQHLGILLIELGVGVTVCGCMLSIFHSFAARGVR